MTPVQGRNVTIYMDAGAGYEVAACATSSSMAVEAEDIEITTVDSGKERDYVGGFTNATLELDGIVTLDDDDFFQFHKIVDQLGNRIQLMILFEDTVSSQTLSYEMTVLVKSVNNDNAVGDFSSYSASFLRCGAWTKNITSGKILLDSFGDPILDSDGDPILTD